SPRAAWRLETLGFDHVYDYVAGKADWASFGLPLEGRDATRPRAANIARTDAPTCRLDEHVAEVAARLPDDWDICVVTNDANVLLGMLGPRALGSDANAPVAQAL